MNLTRDVLDTLGIKAIMVTTDSVDAPCVVTDIMGDIWVCYMTNPPENTSMMFRIKTSNGFVSFKGEVITMPEHDARGLHSFAVRVMSEELAAQMILQNIHAMEKKKAEWDRRREERWNVDDDPICWYALGLTSLSQTVFVGKHSYQCWVRNVSFHGLEITVPSGQLQIGSNVCVRLSFENPTECIHLDASVAAVNNRGSVSIAGLSIADSPVAYMGRVALFATEMERRQ